MPRSHRFLLAMLALWAALFAQSSRFERPEFRAWERLYDPTTLRFEPSRRVEMEEIGDLGHESWVRALQVPRALRFTTDRWGLRNPIDIEHPRVVVLGDSYVAGASVTDRDTLTAAMSRELGEPVYNFGVQSVDAPGLFLRDARFGQRPPEVVVWAPVARQIRPRPLFFPESDAADPSLAGRAIAQLRGAGQALERLETRINRDNGLTRAARRHYNGLRHRLLGHPNLIETDSGPALALDLDAQQLTISADAREVETVIEMVKTFSDFLARYGVQLIYCPLPESGTIYPELFAAADRAALAQPSFLDRLIEGARAAGVRVVDLRPVFRDHKHPYLYQPDDSHWSPRAIALAAQTLSESVRRADASVAANAEPAAR